MDVESNEGQSRVAARATGGYVPRKRANVLALDMGDGVILYDDDASLVLHLNPSASVVWNLCDGEADGDQIAREIAEGLDLNPHEVTAQVADLMRELDALGLIEDAASDGRLQSANGAL